MSKLTYGIGYNSKGKHKTAIGGTPTLVYTTWRNMLKRCYCADTRKRQPTYTGCTVDRKWWDFQDFANWFYGNPYSDLGYHLDKDLLVSNNKVYSPETCCFVPQELNKLLPSRTPVRGGLPQGIFLHEPSSKFRARACADGKLELLGSFDTEQEAYSAYKKAKEAHVKEKAREWQDRIADNVFDALMNWELDDK